MLKIIFPILLYLLIGMIIAVISYVIDVTDDEDDLTMLILLWPFFGLFLIILSPGYIASYLGEFIKRRIEERENDK